MVALLQLIHKICTCIPIPTNMNEASQQHSQYQFKPPPARTSFYRWVCDKCVPASVFEESEENEEEEKSLAIADRNECKRVRELEIIAIKSQKCTCNYQMETIEDLELTFWQFIEVL